MGLKHPLGFREVGWETINLSLGCSFVSLKKFFKVNGRGPLLRMNTEIIFDS